MLYSRLAGRSRTTTVVRRALAVVVAAIALFVSPSWMCLKAAAADKPFWEKSEAAPKAKKSYYTKTSYKKSSYKKSASRKSSSKYGYKSSGKKKSYASRKKLGGYAAATEGKKSNSKGYRVASLGDDAYGNYKPKKSLSGGGVRWTASSSCLNGTLRSVVYQVASNFGPVTVNSTCRSKGHNRAVGGAPKSQHLTGNAVDFRVHGNIRGVYAFLRSSGSVGGLKHYGGGLFHIDTGARRTW
ncbi:MAG: YcbK family protein [Hyphomicrobium sp.]